MRSRHTPSDQQDSFSQEFESGAAQHLTPEHLDAADAAFDDGGIPWRGESGGGDCAEAAFQTVSESVSTALILALGQVQDVGLGRGPHGQWLVEVAE